jgi:hypothetical protein
MRNFTEEANGNPPRSPRSSSPSPTSRSPPLRLLLGKDAYARGRAAWARRLEQDERWQHLSASTDHDHADGDGARWLDN